MLLSQTSAHALNTGHVAYVIVFLRIMRINRISCGMIKYSLYYSLEPEALLISVAIVSWRRATVTSKLTAFDVREVHSLILLYIGRSSRIWQMSWHVVCSADVIQQLAISRSYFAENAKFTVWLHELRRFTSANYARKSKQYESCDPLKRIKRVL